MRRRPTTGHGARIRIGTLFPGWRSPMAAIATTDGWTALAADVDVPRQAFVDGAYVDARAGATLPALSPIDGRVLGEVAACGAADVDRAVAGARAAFESGTWATAAPKE